MASFVDYIKGGEFLIAPSLNYKDQYILKCCECDEYYDRLESLLFHCIRHYRNKMCDVGNDCNNSIDTRAVALQIENTIGVECEDSLSSSERDCAAETVSLIVKEEHKYECYKIEDVQHDAYETEEEFIDIPADANSEIIEKNVDGDHNNLNIKTEPTSLQEPDINYGQLWSKTANEPLELLEQPINADTLDFDREYINVNIDTEPTSLQEPDINYDQMVKIGNEPLDSLDHASTTNDVEVENAEPINTYTIDVDGEYINVIIETEPTSLHEPDINCAQVVEIANDPPELLEHASKTHDVEVENVDPINALLVDEPLIVRDKSSMEYFQKFMKSKANVTALITAYRNESHLWNFTLPVQYRKKEKRTMTWKKIAIDLKKTRNLQISTSQVADCIVYLRQKYREKKRSDELLAKSNMEILPTWAFEQLHFLNPFMESKPVGLLDIHQDLAPKQTTQILNIFERCPHLWDSNTVEFYCSNKRNEALTEMKNIITGEMDLEVEESTLQNFLNCVQKYFGLEKRRELGFDRGVRENARYYEHLLFLNDHVGPFQCSYCRRKVKTSLALKLHESKHNGTVPFKCRQCNDEFKVSDSYVYHMRRHMDDYNYECTECDKKYIRADDLTQHMRVHTGDKPFYCDICSSSFGQRTGFSRHMRIHLHKYSSFCPICSKGFYSKDKMTMHVRSHTDEKPFACSTCGKAFKLKTTLRSHIATHENGNYDCTICRKSFKNRINLWQHKRKYGLNCQINPESPLHFETN